MIGYKGLLSEQEMAVLKSLPVKRKKAVCIRSGKVKKAWNKGLRNTHNKYLHRVTNA
jgi:hypothetical protein